MFLGLFIVGFIGAMHTYIQIGYEDAVEQHKLEQAKGKNQVETNNL